MRVSLSLVWIADCAKLNAEEEKLQLFDICFLFFILALIFIKTGTICCLLSSLQTMAAF